MQISLVHISLKRIAYLVIMLGGSAVHATIINVPADIDSIQGGINLAHDGDTVLVQPGTYVENINLCAKRITLGSLTLVAGDTSYISRTIIDGDSVGNVIRIESGEDSTTIINGFTTINGAAEFGGGIYCNDSSPRLMNLAVRGNRADYGGGIRCLNSSPEVTNVLISHNAAGHGGGGMDNFGSSPTLLNCTFLNNSAVDYGGGLSNDLSSPALTGCVFSGNTSNTGGGISNYTYSDVLLYSCTIVNNEAITGGGMWNGGSSPIITNSIFWDNAPDEISGTSSTVTYSNFQGGYPGEGNLDSDPLFCGPDSGNYYLAENSPCAGSGEAGNDMGALGVGCGPMLGTHDGNLAPLRFDLLQSYPNPFNPVSTIRYDLPQASDVSLIVYNLLGREVATLVDSYIEPGYHKVLWDSRDARGREVPSGIYIARLVTPEYSQSIKMVLLK
ncbi:MAG: T9SS type A sorting domain-containing protein [Fidelibacterota bacterium]|nr:MAG: T9SS type A sorting domain-containing protein [Candidatus Neomarinimicrobiota bacterium]